MGVPSEDHIKLLLWYNMPMTSLPMQGILTAQAAWSETVGMGGSKDEARAALERQLIQAREEVTRLEAAVAYLGGGKPRVQSNSGYAL